ncbi:MAG: acyl carrier protein, partial [Candidatus Omnitrophota bacterium]|nr:acyl carrier protein [Candidatus Omnitrophota bacterium]
EIPQKDLKDDARFAEDLGIDSMKALEIVAAVEKKYRLIVPEEEIPTIRSLQQIFTLVERLMPK